MEKRYSWQARTVSLRHLKFSHNSWMNHTHGSAGIFIFFSCLCVYDWMSRSVKKRLKHFFSVEVLTHTQQKTQRNNFDFYSLTQSYLFCSLFCFFLLRILCVYGGYMAFNTQWTISILRLFLLFPAISLFRILILWLAWECIFARLTHLISIKQTKKRYKN